MTQLARTIALRSAILLVVSSIVGSGVFKKVAPMAAELGSPLLVLGCWIGAGIISMAGALSNAEMAGMFPDSGGEYVYYQKVYGRFFAFLYGWGSFAVMKTATIAAMAYVFGQSLVPVLGLSDEAADGAIKAIASLLILGLSWINYRGVSFAEGLSRALTYLMFGAVAVILLIGFQAQSGSIANLNQPVHLTNQNPNLLNAITIALLGAFWGYEGWNYIGFIGEEVKNPQRTIPMALGIGTLIVIGIYLLLNVVYMYVLPIDTLAQLAQTPNKIAAVEVVRQASGWLGAVFISCLILVTTFNSTNASILMSARIFYAMARDGVFFQSAARIHDKYQTPSVAIFLQGVWSVALVWSGTFDQLTDMLIFASFIFYGATALGVLLLRRKYPDLPRTYRVIGYPVVPALFCLFCAGLVIMTLINQPREALIGLGLMATGVPFYWFWQRQRT
ncbi:MAG: amino acid permease [Cytophagaceae bacterium]|nr:MAG: amino acid permease [Cytophagaceae bacterium]